MPNYKQMYFELFRASVQANNILQAAQKQAEDCYLSDEKAALQVYKNTQPPPKGE